MAEPASPRPSRLGQLRARVRDLVDADAVADAEGRLSRQHQLAHFWILVVQMFVKNRGPVRAASLAYTTLLALVPLLAISVSAATLFLPRTEEERRETLVHWIEKGVSRAAPTLGLSGSGGEDQRERVANQIAGFVERIHFGRITATAAAGLIMVAIGLLRSIEVAFNDIWGTAQSRSWLMSIVFYWAIITLGPAVLLVTKGVKVLSLLGSRGAALETSAFGQFLFSLAEFVSPLLMVLAFGALYFWMPNTRIHWRAALVGGAVAAVLWAANNKLSAIYHGKVLTYNTIYGSLGVLPIFLVGLYLTWLIVLFGAQVSYVFQNRKAYLQERIAGRVNQQAREFAAMRLMTRIGSRFSAGESPLGVSGLAEQLGLPPHLAKELLRILVDARLLNETNGPETGYVPARPLPQITAGNVLQAMRAGSGRNLATTADDQRSVVATALSDVRTAAEATANAITVADLVRSGTVPQVIHRPPGPLAG